MPLIDLQTSLKDLKYGHDEFKGGNSGQPYIKTKIPGTSEPLQTSFGASIDGSDLAVGAANVFLSAAGGAIVGGIFGGGAGALIGGGVGLAAGVLGTSELITGEINYSSLSLKLPKAGTGGPDFLLRGGSLFPGIALSDGERLGKFFLGVEGLLFTTKQNILSRTAVRTEASGFLVNESFYSPTSTLAQAGVVGLGLHLNKQGLNPLQNNSSYQQAVQYSQYDKVSAAGASEGYDSLTENNRLVALHRLKILGTDSALANQFASVKRIRGKFISKITNDPDLYSKDVVKINGIKIDKNDINHLLEYGGGPGAILGIGKTKIKLHCGETRYRYPDPYQTDRKSIIFENDGKSYSVSQI